ncbi:secretory protein [Mucilaginibacter pallidiroseus]|uniref:Secretory protein n=1 Tax=Mucilaginibacter pallidiroseus TaxID=2599295 RepID=A0A563U085_9SPHI|nr:basic secretory protein-like protein [Mucilaginibacter pallidiroseus]TWR23869.1 secretory protein [Mucilaginibacter pallidiroseus]
MKTPAFILTLLFAIAAMCSYAQKIDTIKKDGYTLTVSGNDASFDNGLRQKLINTFFAVYPKIAKEYNKNTSRNVSFFIDTAYKGVAATSDDRVLFSAAYMTKHPGDIDVVTHEVMHIAQAYGQTNGPWWITEGIADYVRNQFGVANPAANWKLPDYSAKQNYDNSYRVTARFFTWIEKKVKKGFVKKMDSLMRDHKYTDNAWKDITGKTVTELWAEYSANPVI